MNTMDRLYEKGYLTDESKKAKAAPTFTTFIGQNWKRQTSRKPPSAKY